MMQHPNAVPRHSLRLSARRPQTSPTRLSRFEANHTRWCRQRKDGSEKLSDSPGGQASIHHRDPALAQGALLPGSPTRQARLFDAGDDPKRDAAMYAEWAELEPDRCAKPTAQVLFPLMVEELAPPLPCSCPTRLWLSGGSIGPRPRSRAVAGHGMSANTAAEHEGGTKARSQPPTGRRPLANMAVMRSHSSLRCSQSSVRSGSSSAHPREQSRRQAGASRCDARVPITWPYPALEQPSSRWIAISTKRQVLPL
jgi:hypothetical protein